MKQFVWLMLLLLGVTLASSAVVTPVENATWVQGTVSPCSLQTYSFNIAYTQFSVVIISIITEGGVDGTLMTNTGESCNLNNDNACNITLACALQNNYEFYIQNTDNTPFQYNVTYFLLTLPFQQAPFGTTLQINNTINNPAVDDITQLYTYVYIPIPNLPLGATATINIIATTNFAVLTSTSGLPFSSQTYSKCSSSSTSSSNDNAAISFNNCFTTTSNVYLAIQRNQNFQNPYSLSITSNYTAPHIGPISPNTATISNGTIVKTGATGTDIYSFDFTNEGNQDIVITVNNIFGGAVSMQYDLGIIPSCNSVSSNIGCSEVQSSCQIIIPACNTHNATYYIEVTSNPNSEVISYVTYSLTLSFNESASPVVLSANQAIADSVLYTAYNQYQITPDSDPQSVFEIYLYQDSGVNQEIMLFVSQEPFSSSCGQNLYKNLSSYGDFIYLQIDPCTFHATPTWYLTVYGSEQTTNGAPISYTLRPAITSPIEISNFNEVINGVVQASEYVHYSLADSLWSDNYFINIQLTSSTNSVLYYWNNGSLAGLGCCYSYIGSVSSPSISNCDGQSQYYLSIYGTQLASYSFVLINPPVPLAPTTELRIGSPITDALVGSQANYTFSPGSSNATLVLSLTSNSPNLELYVNASSNYYCNNTIVPGKSCNPNSDGVCTVVFQPCEYDNSLTYYATVAQPTENTTPPTYTLSVQTFEIEPVELTNNVAVPSQVGYKQYNHYSFQVSDPAPNTELIVVLYINENQTAQGQLFVNFGQLAGPLPCFSSSASYTSSTRAVYVVPPCDLQEGIYYFSVTNTQKTPNFLEYTLTAYTQNAFTYLPLNQVVSFQGYSNQIQYYQFNVTYSTNLVLNIDLGNVVQGSSITLTFTGDLPTNFCSSCQTSGTTIVANGGQDVSAMIDWCSSPLINGASTFFMTLAPVAQPRIALSTATLFISASEYAPIALPQNYVGYSGPNNYTSFSLPCQNQNSLVYMTLGENGPFRVYGRNDGALPTPNCGNLFASSRCDSFSTPCYLIPCMDYNIISISSIADQSFQENYVLSEILSWVVGINQTISNSLVYDAHIYLVQLNNPTSTTQLNFQVISSDSNVDLLFTLSSSFEGADDIYSDSGSNLTYVIPACQINGVTQSWYLSISSSDQVAATYTLNIFTTNINVVPYTNPNNSVVLAPFEVQSFSIAVPQVENYSPLLNIEVISSSSDFNTYLSYGAPASAETCPNTVQCSNTFCELDSCCVNEDEMYYVTIVNGLETQNASIVLTWKNDSYTTNLVLTTPNLTVTTTPVSNDVNYYQFLVSPGTLLTSTSILIVNVNVDNSTTYINFNDPAGLDSTCFSSSSSCAPNSPCILQYYACSFYQIPAGPLVLGIAPNEVATAIISTQILEPIPLNESQLLQTSIQGTLLSHFVIEISDTDVSGFNDITVTISTNGTGDVNGYLNFGNLAGTSSCLSYIAQCETDDDQCVIQVPTCNNGAGLYYLSIENDDDDISNVTVFYAVQPSALYISLNNTTTVDGENYDGVSLNVFPANLTSNAPNYLRAIFSPSSDIDSVEWLYDGTICQASGLACENDGSSYVCIIDTCFLANVIENDGATIDFVVQADDTYTVQTEIVAPAVTTLNVGTVNYEDSVLTGQINYYAVTINEGSLGFGESVTIDVQTPSTACSSGSIQWYIDQGSFPGTGCSIFNCTENLCDPYTFSSCNPGYGGVYYIAVVGLEQTYSQYNVPISYTISISVSSDQYNLIPIDVNEVYSNLSSSNNIYVLSGIGGFTDISISAVSDGSVGLTVGIDTLPSCASPSDIQTCNEQAPQCTIVIPACSKGNTLYIAVNSLSLFNLSVSTPSIVIQNITDETPLPINGFVATTDYYQLGVNGSLIENVLNILFYNYTSELTLNYYVGGLTNISCLTKVGATKICHPPECSIMWNQCMLDDDEDTVFIAITPSSPGVSYSLTVNWTAEVIQLNESLSCVEIPAINGESFSSVIFNVSVPFTPGSEMLSIEVTDVISANPVTAQLLDESTCQFCTAPCTLTVSTCQAASVAVAIMGDGGSTFNIAPTVTQLEATLIGPDPVAGSLSQNFQYTTTSTGNYTVITVSAPSFNAYVKKGGFATAICYDFKTAVSPIVIACTYEAGATYSIFVSASSSYTISAQDYSPIPIALTGGVVSYAPLTPGIQVYQITAPQQSSMLNTGNFSFSSSSSVNYWLNYGAPAGSDCNLVSGVDTSEHVMISTCQYITGNYYATLYSTESCGPNSISALVNFDNEESASVLASGQSLNSILDNDELYEVFSFATGQPANNNSFVYITYSGLPPEAMVQVAPSHLPTTIPTACIQDADPYYFYYIGQFPASYYILVVNPKPSSNGVVYPYQIAAVTGSFIILTENQPWTGGSPFIALPSTLAPATFFTLDIGSYESVVLQASVNSGPLLQIDMYSSVGLDDFISTFICSTNECNIPLVKSSANYPSVTTFTIVVYSTNSNYSIGYTTGSNNCAIPPSEDLFFCSVNYPTWDYGNFTAKDNWAQQQFNTMYDAIVSPTSTCNPTVVLSEACTQALQNFVCATAFPLCDSDGFTTGLCEDICNLVQEECEIQFGDLQMEDYVCGTTSYIDGSQSSCGGCFGYSCGECNGTGESCSLAWWKIFLIVIGAVVAVVLLSAGGYYLYKKRYSRLPAEKIGLLDDQNPENYEAIPDN